MDSSDKKTNIKNLGLVEQISGTDLVLVSVNGKARRALASLLKGQKGDEVELRITETHIQWRMTGGEWHDLISFATLRGPIEDATDKALEAAVEAAKAAIAANTSAENTNNATDKAVAATEAAKQQADRAKQQADNPPTMGENGNWWKWDEATQAYVDTGILAKGGVLYPTFYIDPDTMILYMACQDEISADQFVLIDGCLYFKPR